MLLSFIMLPLVPIHRRKYVGCNCLLSPTCWLTVISLCCLPHAGLAEGQRRRRAERRTPPWLGQRRTGTLAIAMFIFLSLAERYVGRIACLFIYWGFFLSHTQGQRRGDWTTVMSMVTKTLTCLIYIHSKFAQTELKVDHEIFVFLQSIIIFGIMRLGSRFL